MRRTWMAILGFVILAAGAGAEETPVLDTPEERASYAIGVDTARNIRMGEIAVDLDLVIRGLTDEMSGRKLLLGDMDLQAARAATQHEIMRKQAAKKQQTEQGRKTSAEERKNAGESFLAENAKKDGVATLSSGLQYRVLKAGDGRKPADSDSVECNYRGALVDGTVFDSSHSRGKPATFRVSGVIPGLREALKLMPAGSKWQLFVPSALAYGERGSGRVIGPNEALVFEIELLAVK